MQQTPELLNEEDDGLSEAGFAKNQQDFQRQVGRDLTNRNKHEKEKSGDYYIIFLDQQTKQAVLNFIKNEYSKKITSIKADEDPGNIFGVKVSFNNAAHDKKIELSQVLAQRGWHAAKESFVEHTYEPAPLTGPNVPVVEQRPKLKVIKSARPKLPPKPEAEPETWTGKIAA